LPGDFGLADAGRAGKQETADRLGRIAQARTCHLDRRSERIDCRILAEDDHLQIAIEVPEYILVGRRNLLWRYPRHLGDDHLDFLDVHDLLAQLFGHHTLPGTRLVDYVDGLVRQQAIADMLHRQVHRRANRLTGVLHAVMFLKPGFESRENGDRFGHRGLDHVDFLEPPRQRVILLEYTAIFLERGRSDAVQIAGSEHRFDQVGGVHGAAGRRTGADDGVNFVDEQDRARFLFQLREHRLQTLFEIAAVLGARYQRAQVEGVDHAVAQHLRHLFVDDALGKPLGQRGLADARLAHQQRIVLAPATQHLDDAFDFQFTPDQRVDAAGKGRFVEVAGKLVQRVAAGFAALAFGVLRALVGRLGFLVADPGDAMRNVVDHVKTGDLLLLQEIHRMRVLFAEDGHQHVGAGHLFLAGRLHVIYGTLQHALEPECGLGVAAVAGRQHRHRIGHDLAEIGRQTLGIGATGAQHRHRRRILKQRQQQMFDGHELMTRLACLLVALANGEFEILAEHIASGGDRLHRQRVTPFPAYTKAGAAAAAKTRLPALPSFPPLRA